MNPVSATNAAASPWRAVMPRGLQGPLGPSDSFVRSGLEAPPLPRAALPVGAAAAAAADAVGAAMPGAVAVPLRMVLLGPPGSGKSTQGQRLAQEVGVPHVSVGDLVRAEIASGSEVGKSIEKTVQGGSLAPNDLVRDLVRERLSQPDAQKGFVLDGYPRDLEQVPDLERMREDLNWGPIAILGLEIPREEVLARLGQRGRADDVPETIARRLDVYVKESVPVINYYKARGEFVRVDGQGSIEEVAARMRAAAGLQD